MADTPNFRYQKHPRFSVNHLTDYLGTTNAAQRENIIRAAKFPRKPAVAAYSQARRFISEFLLAAEPDMARLDATIARIENDHRREADGWKKDELGRNHAALAAFRASFPTSPLRLRHFAGGRCDLPIDVEGVRINVGVDLTIEEEHRSGERHAGACVLLFVGSAAARREVPERSRKVAAIIHWALEVSAANVEPLPRLCLSVDIYGGEVTKASSSVDRLRHHIRSSCGEIASRWDRVTPPNEYDGPEWP
ncbi:hypothetical protein STAQ_28030 [Allostella sp. ATCC 35155]|nr:hypothetical protein STAQ_28030 [Stella sp. ATCC 35155]